MNVTLCVLALLRTCWVHHVTGVWVYPVLERIAPVARVVFFSAMTAVICVFYTLGEILNSYIWDQPHTGTPHTHTHTSTRRAGFLQSLNIFSLNKCSNVTL